MIAQNTTGILIDMKAAEKKLVGALSKRLRAIKQELSDQQGEHMEVEEFAQMCGANRNAASAWLNGYNYPPVWRMIKLCDATGVTLDFIYRGDRGGLPLNMSIRLQMLVEGDKLHVPPRAATKTEDEVVSRGKGPSLEALGKAEKAPVSRGRMKPKARGKV